MKMTEVVSAMADTNDIYNSYHAMSGEITEGLSRMADLCGQLGMDSRRQALLDGKKRLQSHKFSVGILGEFNRGKSTVINALLGREIMPTDILPCSATMNRVSYGLEPRVQLSMVDGTVEDIGVDELAQYVTKLDEDSSAKAEKVEEATVFYPCRFCQNGVDIIDTPGLNDDERMNKITERTVPKLDAVIMVVGADSPFSMSEANFVLGNLMCSDIGRLIFLVNKIDLVRPKDRQRLLANIRAKIEKSVLEKSLELYGEDSDYYAAVRRKLAEIRIYPVSAQNALDGRIGACESEAENELLVSRSGFVEFETALSKLLTEERGFLELGTPLSQLLRCGAETKEKIGTYIDAMDSDQEAFRSAQRELLSRQQGMLRDKEEQKRRLNTLANELKGSLGVKTGEVYRQMEAEALELIARMSPADPKKELKDVDKQILVEETVGKIDAMCSEKLSDFCVRICAEVNEVVGREAIQVSNFIAKSQRELLDVQAMFSRDPDKRMTQVVDAMGIALDVATDFIGLYGLGGVISGFRAAGVKGALLGGAAGLAANLAVCNLVLAPLAAPLLPAFIISCAVGTVASKLVCSKLFAGSKNEKELEKLRKSVSEATKQNFAHMREERVLENWIDSTVTEQFDSLCSTMDSECESAIREAEESISRIKLDLARSSAEKKAAKESYIGLGEAVDALIMSLEPLRLKLAAHSVQGAVRMQ